jgi:hypothetical protein
VSTPLSGPVEANVPPRQRLASLAYRRDALYQSAAENDAAAQARLQELREQRRLGQLDPAYDIDADHRAAEQVSQQHDDLERTLRGGPGGPGSGVAKAQVPSRQRTTGGSA